MCFMRRNRKLAYIALRDYKDVNMCHQICYTDHAEHAADVLGIEANQVGKELAYFRVSGTVIPEGGGKSPMWIIGKWLQTERTLRFISGRYKVVRQTQWSIEAK